ncbi:MAG: tetratricopeptide repeat protein, partial [Bryobacteraceae bacterium]
FRAGLIYWVGNVSYSISLPMNRLGLVLAIALAGPVFGADLDQARQLYNRTEYKRSLEVLRAILAKGGAKDAAVWALSGRNEYMLTDFKRASEAFEKAVALEPHNSEYALWLGRAYGRRAETSSPFTAPGYASRARQNFERAVQLNPGNMDALNDVFEYYLEAPGFLGGGMDKARATAARIGDISPGEGYQALARLAEKQKEYATAEMELRRAVEVTPQTVGRFIELARFLARQGRFHESDQSLARAEKLAPNNPRVIFAKADIYLQSGRNRDQAGKLLRRYMTLSLSPDDPPREEAAKLLKRALGG